MGSTHSCQNIEPRINNICNIGACTTKVQGASSNSASPTDIWFLTLYDGAKYGGVEVNGRVVLKLFIMPDVRVNYGPFKHLVRRGYSEMLYESKVYEYVVGPMLANNINPHFVRYYGRALNCSYDNLVNVLNGKEGVNKNGSVWSIDKRLAEQLVLRSTDAMLQKDPSPSITSTEDTGVRVSPELKGKLNEIRYGMIATQESNGVTLKKWLQRDNRRRLMGSGRGGSGRVRIQGRNMGITPEGRLIPAGLQQRPEDVGGFDTDTWIIILQVVTALVALSTFECAHNDLHIGNIMVNREPETTYHYKYLDAGTGKEMTFSLTTEWRAALYDWDRAYAPFLGNNPKLTTYYCEKFMNCNQYIPQRDITKFFVYLYKTTRFPLDKAKLITLLWEPGHNTEQEAWVENVLNNDTRASFLIDKRTGKTMTAEDFRYIRHPSSVLTGLSAMLSEMLGFVSKKRVSLPEETSKHDKHRDDPYITFDTSPLRVAKILRGYCKGNCVSGKCPAGMRCMDGMCCRGYRSSLEVEEDTQHFNDGYNHWIASQTSETTSTTAPLPNRAIYAGDGTAVEETKAESRVKPILKPPPRINTRKLAQLFPLDSNYDEDDDEAYIPSPPSLSYLDKKLMLEGKSLKKSSSGRSKRK